MSNIEIIGGLNNMKEIDYSSQEAQHNVSNFYITLLSGEIIEIPCLRSEDITETRDSSVFICLESVTYNDKLYQAFKNKELIQFIRKESELVKADATTVNREFTYNHYFKISEFGTSLNMDRSATYNITFETV